MKNLSSIVLLAYVFNLGCTSVTKSDGSVRQPSSESAAFDGINHNPKTSCEGLDQIINAAEGTDYRRDSKVTRCYTDLAAWKIMTQFFSAMNQGKVAPIRNRGTPFTMEGYQASIATGWRVKLVMISWSPNQPYKFTILMTPPGYPTPLENVLSGSFNVDQNFKGTFDFLI